MTNPRWTDEIESMVADAFRRVDTSYIAAQPDGYHRMNARALLVSLANAGLLLPPGGVTEAEESYSHRDGTDCSNEECWPRIRVRRTVTTWPDGTELMTPWQPVPPSGLDVHTDTTNGRQR